PMVMASHCIYDAFDKVPAGLSSVILTDFLRGELNFDGVIVSDDMRMEALPQQESAWADSIVQAISAGVDLLLVCRDIDRAFLAVDVLQKAAARDRQFAKRLEAALNNVEKMRKRLKPGNH